MTETATETPTITVGSNEYRQTLPLLEIDGESFALLPDGRVRRSCGRCGGRGGIVHYGHVYDGECFECRWTGLTTTWASVKKAEQAAASRARRRAKARAEEEARAAVALAATRERDHAEALREDARRTAQAAKADGSRYLGELGEKITITGTVTVSYALESVYGTRYLIVIEGTGQDAGVTVKTIGTSVFHYEAERGDEVKLTGTVKDHEVYRDVKQTVVIRPKLAK